MLPLFHALRLFDTGEYKVIGFFPCQSIEFLFINKTSRWVVDIQPEKYFTTLPYRNPCSVQIPWLDRPKYLYTKYSHHIKDKNV